MDRIPLTPPVIKPISANISRPLWSVMIPVYNCSHYLKFALQSVLDQDQGKEEMQIEVIDDASTDADVSEIVNRIGQGRVKYYRQPQNVGSLRNFETCINRSTGNIIHLLHGDDRVKLGYYKKISSLFEQYPTSGAAFCRYNYINEEGNEKFTQYPEMDSDGILDNWLLRIAETCTVQYVSIAVKREVYEKLGAFYGLIYGEDWVMWVRMAQQYSIAYTPEVLADYRQHDGSITGVKFLNGEIMKDTMRVFQMIQDNLPETHRKKIIKSARKKSANYGLHIAQSVWHQTKNIQYVNANVKQIISMYPSDPALYKSLISLYIQMFKAGIKRILTSVKIH